MARLIVTALSEDGVAAPGNRKPNYLVVSVTDVNGVPVSGLGPSNFKAHAVIVAAYGADVTVTRTVESGLPGFYIVDVVPIGTHTWKSGVYIFAVAVERGADNGQTLASVLMD